MSDFRSIKSELIPEDRYVKIDIPKETPPFITPHEKARVIGLRITQLSRNAPTMFSVSELQNMKNKNPYLTAIEIANAEYRAGIIPLLVRRFLTDGTFEDWKLSEFRDFI